MSTKGQQKKHTLSSVRTQSITTGAPCKCGPYTETFRAEALRLASGSGSRPAAARHLITALQAAKSGALGAVSRQYGRRTGGPAAVARRGRARTTGAR